MQTHKRKKLAGPVSGARPWWRTHEIPEAPLTSNPKEPMFRAALVEQIRQEIARGSYDTPEKWDAALDRLLDRLSGDEV
jgi:hypothetical protein